MSILSSEETEQAVLLLLCFCDGRIQNLGTFFVSCPLRDDILAALIDIDRRQVILGDVFITGHKIFTLSSILLIFDSPTTTDQNIDARQTPGVGDGRTPDQIARQVLGSVLFSR